MVTTARQSDSIGSDDKLTPGANHLTMVASGLEVVAPSTVPARRSAVRSWIFNFQVLSFFLLVVIPNICGVVYFQFLASSQYMSEVRFGIRSADSAVSQADSGLLRGLGVADQSVNDSFAIVQYLQSRELVDQLQSEVDIRSLFSRPTIDFFSRFDPSRSVEELVDYWKRQADIYYETTTGTIVVRVRAFSAQDALNITNQVLKRSENLVNELSRRSRLDSVKFAEGDLLAAENRLRNAQTAVRKLQDSQGILDPRQAAVATSELIEKVRGELTQSNIELSSQLSNLSRTAPTVQNTMNRIASLKEELAKLQSQLTASGKGTSGDSSISNIVSAYENAQIEKDFSQQYYTTTLQLLQKAKIEAKRQQKYIAPFVNPSLPEEALYPKRIRDIFTVLMASLAAWAVSMLTISSIRDHL